ncbi:MAG: translation elongation factor 4 [Candidatus Paceibacterota bacterium]
MKNIRNFSIISHVDHGKSTLADRMLEETATIDARHMRDQVLDSMDLERERGITIKMQPVRMRIDHGGEKYILNLIDTPGHIDFSYEVSRSLRAVEGVVLLVDGTQGVQAQTLTTLQMAKELGRVIVPVVSKVDILYARVDETKLELAEIVGCDVDDVLEVSGKTGQGVAELLHTIIDRVPAPEKSETDDLKALVFDFEYSEHRGIIVYLRLMSGTLKEGDSLELAQSGNEFKALEVGVAVPDRVSTEKLGPGDIGYVVTGIKEAGVASVGDTVREQGAGTTPLQGYMIPSPVIWASIFPESQDDFDDLRQALGRLRLSDSSLSFEEESSTALGRGFRCGFLGTLHLEIITERLKREFGLELIVASPSITYCVTSEDGVEEIRSPARFPEHGKIEEIEEQWASVELLTPRKYVDILMQLFYEYEADVKNTSVFGDGRTAFDIVMPLRELVRNFFDEVKRVSSGYASLSYTIQEGWHEADVQRLDILVAGELIPAFSRIVSRRRVEQEARSLVENLHELLPRQLTATKIQAQAHGRIIASQTLSALKKDVTGHLYGGDITRKMKLREKQKEGKKRMQKGARASIPHDVFMEVIRRSREK